MTDTRLPFRPALPPRPRAALGFTFLELLVVMAMIALLMGFGIGWLTSIGRSARAKQAASILTESAFRCQNASAGGKRATLMIRRKRDAEGAERLWVTTAVQRPILTANFEPAPAEHPELEWFVNAAGGPEWARPGGSVRLEDDGRTAVTLARGGSLDFGTRAGYAVTDGIGIECYVKPASSQGTMTILKSSEGSQTFWSLRLMKDNVGGPDLYKVVLTLFLVPEDSPEGTAMASGDTFATKDACVPAGMWSDIKASFDGRDVSIRVRGVEHYMPPRTPRGTGASPGAGGKAPGAPAAPAAPVAEESPARRFVTTPAGVAHLTLSSGESSYVGSVDELLVTGVFRSPEDEQALSGIDVLRPTLPIRVVYANGRLDPARHLTDVVILLSSPMDAETGTAYEVRYGLYGDIPPPKRILPPAPPAGAPTTPSGAPAPAGGGVPAPGMGP